MTRRCPPPDLTPTPAHPWFFCGIGGSGMLPLATILKGQGAEVAGSDRSYDQGRTPEKFAWLEAQGFALFPQDGSGVTSPEQTLVASAAIEDTVPEVVRAARARLPADDPRRAARRAVQRRAAGHRGRRHQRQVDRHRHARLDHAPGRPRPDDHERRGDEELRLARRAVRQRARRPGRRRSSPKSTKATARSRSTGPTVAVLLNVSLDHKSMDELRALFGDFLAAAPRAAVNLDDPESARAGRTRADEVVGFGIDAPRRADRRRAGIDRGQRRPGSPRR